MGHPKGVLRDGITCVGTRCGPTSVQGNGPTDRTEYWQDYYELKKEDLAWVEKRRVRARENMRALRARRRGAL